MKFAKVLLVFLGMTQLAFAQEEKAATPVELKPLPEEVALDFSGRIQAIEEQERLVDQLRDSFSKAEGLRANLYSSRIDALWGSMFNNTVRLAVDIAEQYENGFDVTAYAENVEASLQVFPEESQAALERLRDSIVFPTTDMSPAEFVVADQALLRSIQKFDFVLQSMITFHEIAEQLSIEDQENLDLLLQTLEETAANRSAFLQIALDDVTVLRAAAAALSTDSEVVAKQAVTEARVGVATDSLESAVDLMNQVDMDTSLYSQQLVTTTGELSADVLDVGVISGIVSDWTASIADTVTTEGPRLMFRVFIVVIILFIFINLGRGAQAIMKRALQSSKVRFSALLTEMIVKSVKNIVILFGILIALSQLGISLGPLLAGLGIAGFIVGFALQDTLSNFASGMLILIYKPFDVGDFVTAGGVTGKVGHMSLVNTTFKTIDNQVLVVPNNLIWSSVITNVTAQRLRRVDLLFGVSYSDDIEKVEKVLREIVDEHELVLETPEPDVRLHELGDSSVNFICRPWVKTDDYWEVYWDMLRTVKMRFDKEGISIPFPQRDVHMIQE
ncbi:MAG: mechanosensitive ion channel domain-containing protein [Woeseiaceae bacterium]